MNTREFVTHLQDRLGAAGTMKRHGTDIIAQFVAPSSAFCGPGIRPKYLGDTPDGEGRYGLTRRQVERVLIAFDVTLPPSWESQAKPRSGPGRPPKGGY